MLQFRYLRLPCLERLRLREEWLKFKRDRYESWKKLMEEKGRQKENWFKVRVQLQREKLELRRDGFALRRKNGKREEECLDCRFPSRVGPSRLGRITFLRIPRLPPEDEASPREWPGIGTPGGPPPRVVGPEGKRNGGRDG